jgi:hypothetical protein
MRTNIPRVIRGFRTAVSKNGMVITLAWREWSCLSFVTLTNGGTGYSSAPIVGFAGGAGFGAAATATVGGGSVTAITMTASGSGYTNAPSVTFTGGGGTGAAAVVELYRLNPVTQARQGLSVPRTSTVKALVHFPEIAKPAVRQHNEVETGNCIVDFVDDVPVDDLPGLRFTIDGEKWMIKPVSDRLAKMWDVKVAGKRICRTVLLEKQT